MEQVKKPKSVNQVRDGIQVKMGSRLEYYILRSKFKQRINVGKKIQEEIAQRAISSRYGNFVFVVYLVLGLLIIFMKDFP
jgi:hypothetical protein